MSILQEQRTPIHRRPVWQQLSTHKLAWQTDTTIPTPAVRPAWPQPDHAARHLARLGHGVLVTPDTVLTYHGASLHDPPGTGPRSRVVASGTVGLFDAAQVTLVLPDTLMWALSGGQPHWTATATLPRHVWRRVARREHLLVVRMVGQRWGGARNAALVADHVTFVRHEKREHGAQWVHLQARGTL